MNGFNDANLLDFLLKFLKLCVKILTYNDSHLNLYQWISQKKTKLLLLGCPYA